ncbi:TetR/AcrR family transcriptional regulator [Streptomyces sp. NEAU-YJ-81]|uniref:TetR/AcrR family transcriptional regulator n=1 Tax=Streptomyces sp. NEAU-YJ-81 TaxID=2820288 RepID=UPI001ABCB1C9|nr:TetR/AcrR family transcriptional regulator [Streptomyces sp. NEAU-YJ-81]MBO3679609.1 TetR/AcrR family transcriptional regulator [Streptomyces sp. NEAU-YJ-81]
MPRASRAEAERHREQVIAATAKLVRTHGADKVSVPQAMAAAGLTHGGFYRHFASKDDLIAQACSAAFAERLAAMNDLAEGEDAGADTGQGTDEGTGEDRGRGARAAFLATYLSTLHRDNPALGCAAAALAVDAARAEPGDPLRRAYADGMRNLVDGMERLTRKSGDTSPDEGTILVELSTMIGALVLSRACAGDDLSDRILTAVRDHVLGDDEYSPGGKGTSETAG